MKFRELVKRSLPPAVRHYVRRIRALLSDDRQQFSYAYLGNNRGLTTLHDGHLIFVDTCGVQIAPHLIVKGRWETWIENCLRRLLRPGDVCVEVGANLGYYTLIMAAITGPNGRVFSFEANPRIFELLTDSISVNGYTDRVALYQKAALDRNGVVEFVFSDTYSGSGHVTNEANGTSQGGTVTTSVEAITLDEALKDFEGHLDCIRLDAEGSEPLILDGGRELMMRSPEVIIVMEWHTAMLCTLCDLPDFIGKLIGAGYEIWEITSESTLIPADRERLMRLTGDVVIARQRDRLLPMIVA